jgi:protease PrsW
MVWGILAVAIATTWGYAFYREDVHDREPLWLLAVAVAGGALSLWPALWMENWLLPGGVDWERTLSTRLGAVFLVAGPVEELCKFAAVGLLVAPRASFNEPMDGIVYAVMAAIGFATAENFYYMAGDPGVILFRGPISVAAHILFAAFWGGALAHARLVTGRARRFILLLAGLVISAAVHGLFDAIVFAGQHELTLGLSRAAQISLVLACFAFLRWRIRVALAQSPFRRVK